MIFMIIIEMGYFTHMVQQVLVELILFQASVKIFPAYSCKSFRFDSYFPIMNLQSFCLEAIDVIK